MYLRNLLLEAVVAKMKAYNSIYSDKYYIRDMGTRRIGAYLRKPAFRGCTEVLCGVFVWCTCVLCLRGVSVSVCCVCVVCVWSVCVVCLCAVTVRCVRLCGVSVCCLCAVCLCGVSVCCVCAVCVSVW